MQFIKVRKQSGHISLLPVHRIKYIREHTHNDTPVVLARIDGFDGDIYIYSGAESHDYVEWLSEKLGALDYGAERVSTEPEPGEVAKDAQAET